MREGVRNRMVKLRGTLDSWIQTEYTPVQLPFDRFTDVYFGDAPPTRFEKSMPQHLRETHMASLAEAKQILMEHYTPTKARTLASSIDQMIKSLATWK